MQINPVQADGMELWQIAALMDDGSAPNTPSGMQGFTSKPTPAGEALIAARVQAAREGREIDSREMVTGISEDEMTAFLEQRIGAG